MADVLDRRDLDRDRDRRGCDCNGSILFFFLLLAIIFASDFFD